MSDPRRDSMREEHIRRVENILHFEPRLLEGKRDLDRKIIIDYYDALYRNRLYGRSLWKFEHGKEEDWEELAHMAEEFQDVTLKFWETQREAINEPKTGLLTTRAMDKRFEIEQEHALKREGESKKGALVFIDLDFYKRINDTFGHPVGDALLRKIGDVLNSELRPSDSACRFGGDEILLYLDQIDETKIESAVFRIFKRLTQIGINPNTGEVIDGIPEGEETEWRLSVSMGVKPCIIDANFDKDKMLSEADRGTYQTKESGRTGYTFVTREKKGKLYGKTVLFDKKTGMRREDVVAEEKEFVPKKERKITREGTLNEIMTALVDPLRCARGQKVNKGQLPRHIQDKIIDLADAVFRECT